MLVSRRVSGQIIATSHDLTSKGSKSEGKWDPLFQGNLGWWNIKKIGQRVSIHFHRFLFLHLFDFWQPLIGNRIKGPNSIDWFSRWKKAKVAAWPRMSHHTEVMFESSQFIPTCFQRRQDIEYLLVILFVHLVCFCLRLISPPVAFDPVLCSCIGINSEYSWCQFFRTQRMIFVGFTQSSEVCERMLAHLRAISNHVSRSGAPSKGMYLPQ